MESLRQFLDRHQPLARWQEEWLGVPLTFSLALSEDLPPRSYIASVRALVLHGEDVLVVHSSPPILTVGGRREPDETVEQTLIREVGEESGWVVTPITTIGFVHVHHLDGQRPDWARPAPDFVGPIFAAAAVRYDRALLHDNETRCEFVPIVDIERLGVDAGNRALLHEALRRRSQM